ncbi:DDB1- and CUL4-associated factor 10 [Galendromus occidentalis]|uniref:DDB1- and CUL4-associated factor 10 n=1 Tax=Galendromus occidentalis TaxID=34638 RepID=A0AAJ6QMU1_9ACAR|nr:DDB1- and CUL4-associated factor 10 [Galendromus occidentalis]
MFDDVEYVCPEHFVIHCMLTRGRSENTRRPGHQQTWCQRVYNRQLGLRSREPMGAGIRRIYSHMGNTDSPFPSDSTNTAHGGIFNLSFSDDGRTLVAATERRRILVLDPLSHKLVHSVTDAHQDCVNYVRFLDSRVIASCSDDMTIKLWDVRSLRMHVNLLQGHEGWVKNIEYSKKDNLLITSGFDGNIQKWDINNLGQQYDVQSNRIMHHTGLMRMRLVPDESKMILCTTHGYLIVVHDLDLNTFKDDLSKFQPDGIRLLQRNQIGYGTSIEDCERILTATRNRIEFITDFPLGDKAEVISSLQVHPKGWCVLSRNTSMEEMGEWTCVHDIQGLDRSEAPEAEKSSSRKRSRHSAHRSEPDRRRPRIELFGIYQRNPDRLDEAEDYDVRGLRFRIDNYRSQQPQVSIIESVGEQSDLEDDSSEEANDERSPSRGVRIFEISTRDLVDPRVEVRRPRVHEIPLYITANNRGQPSDPRVVFINRSSMHSGAHGRPFQEESLAAKYNKPRLLYYLDEPNVGRGFIKELCFSPDGRIICSPYYSGYRLFAFDDSCSELADRVPRTPRKLTPISSLQCTGSFVVSSKFSPTQHLLVTGCLSGMINFFEPKF